MAKPIFDWRLSICSGANNADTRPGRWLNAGCGSGYFSHMFSAAIMKDSDIDTSASMIQATTEIAMKAKLSGLLHF
jgi:SAM-dependent methyltransferase